MTESLHDHQIDEILKLGAWRDAGRLLAVGLHGKVSKYEDDKEYEDEQRQWQGAATSASPSPPPASAASGAAPISKPAGADRSEPLVEKYLGLGPEILLYYPSANFRKVEQGLWITARIYPLGKIGPCFWVCLFLPLSAQASPKAFALSRLSPLPRPVGPRHTNFPDGSICAFTDQDDAWRPGDSPKILLNLYAEWLVCQLFQRIKQRWPGRQVGLDATYRQLEFNRDEWCDCDSGKRYGVCHHDLDAVQVDALKASGEYTALAPRVVPDTIIKFANSRWKKVPDLTKLQFFRYAGLPSR